MGGGSGGGSAVKDIMSGTVAGFAQVAVGKTQSPPHVGLCPSRVLRVPQKVHLLFTAAWVTAT